MTSVSREFTIAFSLQTRFAPSSGGSNDEHERPSIDGSGGVHGGTDAGELGNPWAIRPLVPVAVGCLTSARGCKPHHPGKGARGQRTLITKGTVYQLGRVYEAGMPLPATRHFSLHIPQAYVIQSKNEAIYHDEVISGELGQLAPSSTGSVILALGSSSTTVIAAPNLRDRADSPSLASNTSAPSSREVC